MAITLSTPRPSLRCRPLLVSAVAFEGFAQTIRTAQRGGQCAATIPTLSHLIANTSNIPSRQQTLLGDSVVKGINVIDREVEENNDMRIKYFRGV